MRPRVFVTGDRFVAVLQGVGLAKQAWEDWLRREGDDARERFYSSYLDMLGYCEAEFGSVSNLYALAAYAVWLNTPKRLRVPASQTELSQMLGFTNDGVFRKWRKRYPALFSDERTRDVVRAIIMDRIPDVVDAMLESAVNGGVQGFQDRKLALEIGKLYKASTETIVSGESAIRLTWGEAEMESDDGAQGGGA